jgi:hypothetical protein
MKGLLPALILWTQLAQPEIGLVKTLRVPPPQRTTDVIWLKVTLGTLQQGREVEISTPAGRLLGVISPFSKQAERQGGAYLVPIPVDAVAKQELVIRLVVTRGDIKRTPKVDEIKKIELVRSK